MNHNDANGTTMKVRGADEEEVRLLDRPEPPPPDSTTPTPTISLLVNDRPKFYYSDPETLHEEVRGDENVETAVVVNPLLDLDPKAPTRPKMKNCVVISTQALPGLKPRKSRYVGTHLERWIHNSLQSRSIPSIVLRL